MKNLLKRRNLSLHLACSKNHNLLLIYLNCLILCVYLENKINRFDSCLICENIFSLFSMQSIAKKLTSTFGIVFDISGVLVNGKSVIPGAVESLKLLKEKQYILLNSFYCRVPYIFVTNGGGVLEAKKANSLSKLLDFPVTADQILLCHTPYKGLVEKYKDSRILVLILKFYHYLGIGYWCRRFLTGSQRIWIY